jgi:alkylation response protein AidB-like acyl-CoA dehydrogenase
MQNHDTSDGNDRNDGNVIAARGGSFLLEERGFREVLTPEDLGDSERMLARTTAHWMEQDVLAQLPAILALDYGAIRTLMRQAGQLGLLGIEIPARYGGLGLDCVSATVAIEHIAREPSFITTYAAHTGIGTLPILYFGTEEQKQKYLPRFDSGEWIASYSLSEASSASDAMNARTRAVLSADGSRWILNGEKMWLTNAGIADVYTTFAKVDGQHFTAFIIDRGAPGVSLGPEEKKTGIKGSSTRPLILSDAQIPRDNVLGQIGQGHRIAFNVLNVGRYKLGAGCVGGAKLAMAEVVGYARGRTAFGRPIAEFGLIREKIGEMAIRLYAAEAAVYRTAGLIAASVAGADLADAPAYLRRIEEYDVECSMVKVWCSEALDYVVDEGVQIHGGAGFVEDYPAERHWRDARINRIFEGTNEINRLLVPGRLLRRALKGDLPLFASAARVVEEASGPESAVASAAASGQDAADGFLADERALVAGARKVALICLGLAARRFAQALAEEQEILGQFANIAMETYALESAVLRARKRAAAAGVEGARLQEAAVRCLAQDAAHRIEGAARRLLAAVHDGEDEAALRRSLAAVARFLARPTLNTVALRRQVAAAAVEQGGYPLG